MSVVALAIVPLDSHVSRRYTRTDATIVADRGRHRADGHIASTQFELQAQRGTNRWRAQRSRLRSGSRERWALSSNRCMAPRRWRHGTGQGGRAASHYACGAGDFGKSDEHPVETRLLIQRIFRHACRKTTMQAKHGRAARTALRITSVFFATRVDSCTGVVAHVEGIVRRGLN